MCAWMYSQCKAKVTGSSTGSFKLSCCTLQVTFLPSSWLEGTKVKKLVTVYVPPGSLVSLVGMFSCDNQEISAGGSPPVDTQRATGTGSEGSGLSGTARALAVLWGRAARGTRRTGHLLLVSPPKSVSTGEGTFKGSGSNPLSAPQQLGDLGQVRASVSLCVNWG
jgi:hypothetical protein